MPFDRTHSKRHQVRAIGKPVGDGARANEVIADLLGNTFET